MTAFTARREPKPSEVRNPASRQPTQPPRLARERDEQLLRQRSSTPPENHQVQFVRRDVPIRNFVETRVLDDPTSPASSVSTLGSHVARGLVLSPTPSTASFDSPGPIAQQLKKRTRSESQYSELSDIAEERFDNFGNSPNQSARQSRIRVEELLYSGPSQNSPTDLPPIASSAVKQAEVSPGKKPLQLAPWPAGQPRLINHAAAAHEEEEEGQPKKKRLGIKTAYKNQEEKDKVKAVRDSGACMRCVIFRQACDVLRAQGQTCKACEVVSRKWHIPCTKIWLRDRCWSLLPERFFDHLQQDKEAAFPRYPPANRTHSFPLKLVQPFIFEVEINVYGIKDVQIDPNMFIKTTYAFKEGGFGARPKELPEMTLPLMPELTSDAVETVEKAGGECLARISKNPRCLPDIVFPEGEGHKWVKRVFENICRFQADILQGQSQALDHALQTVFLRTLISRTLDIPAEDIRWLAGKLPNGMKLHPEDVEILERGDLEVCPKYADRFVKSVMLDLLKAKLLPRCFADLEDLFHLMDKDHGKSKLSELSRYEVFCTTAVVLLVAGLSQTRILQAARLRIKTNWDNVNNIPNGDANLMNEAYSCIYKIEAQVIDHLLHLWTYQFKKEKMVGEVKPEQERAAYAAEMANPIGWFKNSIMAHGDSLSRVQLELRLDKENLEQFLDENLTRILLRLNSVLWYPKTKNR